VFLPDSSDQIVSSADPCIRWILDWALGAGRWAL